MTPETEPEPLLTIDRLVRVRAKPGVRGAVRVVLRGACVGTMADLAGDASCVDAENTRVPVAEAPLSAGETSALGRSLTGTFGVERPCTIAPRAAGFAADGTPLHDEEVCIPGSAFILGSSDSIFTEATDLPERIAVLAPFLMDRFEVTVARYRKALGDGFTSPDDTPYANEGPLPPVPIDITSPTLCTHSAAPRGRETYGLACVSPRAARAFCRHFGGDLPTEAQWEYAAAVAARPFRTRFAWGGPDSDVPSCARAVWGRGELTLATQQCLDINGHGFGPQPVDARAGDHGDVTPALGIVGLGGGLSEWTRDAFAPMTANCWASSSLADPGCDTPSDSRTARGGNWREGPVSLYVAARLRAQGSNGSLGFRCVRAGAP
jgi:formylglycine-generating enzyme required for sulfatase activity